MLTLSYRDEPPGRNNNLGFRLASSGIPPFWRAEGPDPGDHGLPGSAPPPIIRLRFPRSGGHFPRGRTPPAPPDMRAMSHAPVGYFSRRNWEDFDEAEPAEPDLGRP